MLLQRSPLPSQRFRFSGVAGLALSLLLSAFTSAAHAQTTADGFTYTADNDQITITGYSGIGGAVTIPGTINVSGKKLPVTSIGNHAFHYYKLTSVTIPASVTSIGEGAFSGCHHLTSITVHPANPAYASSADGILFDKSKTTLIQFPACKSGSYMIPAGVTSIGTRAFSGNEGITGATTGLTSVTIPASVTSIGEGALAGCDGLTSITVHPANPAYSSADGILFDKSKTTLIQFPTCKSGAYTIPSSATSIGTRAFAGCSGLTSIMIPASVTSIGMAAFAHCESLKTAIFTGNAPTMGSGIARKGSKVFDSSVPGFKVQYYNGATGFTSPTWNGYPAVNMGNRPAAH